MSPCVCRRAAHSPSRRPTQSPLPTTDGFTADDAGNFGEAQSVKGKIIQVTNAVRTLLRVPLIGESSHRDGSACAFAVTCTLRSGLPRKGMAVVHPRSGHRASLRLSLSLLSLSLLPSLDPPTGINLVTVAYLIFLG